MKQPINEVKRMQQLAGIITESQVNETSNAKYSVKPSKKGFSVIKISTGDEITSFDNEEKAKQHAEKLNKMKVIPKEKFKEGFQGDNNDGDGLSGFRSNSPLRNPPSEEDKIRRKNHEDMLKYGLQGVADWKRGVDLEYGPYKDKDSFEYRYWKKGWEEAELADYKRKNKLKNK